MAPPVYLLAFTPLWDLPWVWAGLNDLLLTKECSQSDGMSLLKLDYQKDSGFPFGVLPCLLLGISLWMKLVALGWGNLVGKPRYITMEIRLPRPSNSHMSERGGRSCPSWALRWPRSAIWLQPPWGSLSQNHPARPLSDSWSLESVGS